MAEITCSLSRHRLFLITLFIVSSVEALSINPVLLRISDAVKPGKLMSINGEGLDSAQVTVAFYRDTSGSSPATPPAGWIAGEVVQYDVQGRFLVTRFPDFLQPGVYNVWVQNAQGWSNPIKLNAARVLYLSEKEAWAGEQIKIVGRNFDGSEFSSPANTIVRLKNGSNSYLQVIDSVTPYCVTFSIPASTPLGNYTVEISSDGGINWSSPSSGQALSVVNIGRDDYGLGVAWANDFNYDTVYNVTNYGVPVNSGTDVTAAVQSVITLVKNQGGGVVYFPNGTYKMTSISLPSVIILKGEDMYQTQLQYFYSPAANDVFINATFDGHLNGKMGLYNLSLVMANPSDSVKTDFFWPDCLASKIFVKNVNIYYPPTISQSAPAKGRAMIITADERVLVSNCRVTGWNANIELNAKRYATFTRNYIENSTGIMVISYAVYTFFENDSLKGHQPNNVGQHSGLCARDFSYFSNNYVEDIGSNINDGEAIMCESPTGEINYGTVTSAGTNYIDAAPQSASNPVGYPLFTNYGTLSLQIIDGKGLGQLRKITGIAGSIITVDPPWQVMPDTGSRWSMLLPLQGITWYKNEIKDCGAGYIMYGQWVDGVVAENIATNSIGVSVHAVAHDDGFSCGYFNRIARNQINGVSWHVFYGSISLNPARFNPAFGGVYAGVQVYGNEIKENNLTGDPLANPVVGYTAPHTQAHIALCEYIGTNFYGGYYSGDFVARDLLNTIVEDNSLNSARYGIEITRGNYGVVSCNNSFSGITIDTFSITAGVENVIQHGCGLTVSINEIKSETPSAIVYPNPASDMVLIQLNDKHSPVNRVEVYNLLGEVLHSFNMLGADGYRIDISDLPQGCYILNITCNDERQYLARVMKM